MLELALTLKSKVDKDSSNNLISEYNFTFDNVGNIVTENGNNNNITNVYSDIYELEQQVKKDDSQTLLHQYTYTYDDEGNILTRSDENGVVETMTYVDGNKLATYNGASVIYDNDGNMTSGPLNGVNAAYTFDSRNQLNSVGDHTYKYDAQGRRIEVDVNGDTTEFVVNPLAGYNQILIKTAPSGVDTYYVYGIGLISEETANVSSYYHFDNRGSTIALTSSNETITDTFEYGPYGETISRTGTSDNLFRFNGKYGVVTDQNNLIFMMTRYYNTDMRRFISKDNFLGSIERSLNINQFIFTENNPINFIDPKGLYKEENGLVDFLNGLLDIFSWDNKESKNSKSEISYTSNSIIDTNKSAEENLGMVIGDFAQNNDIVLDATIAVSIAGHGSFAVGVSSITSIRNNYQATYFHLGGGVSASLSPLNADFAIGIVTGVESPEDYSGPFHDNSIGSGVGIERAYYGEVESFAITVGSSVGAERRLDFYHLTGVEYFGD
ncbi:MAG: RHS repeat-associated core domain-containing protein [Clostridiales bacterium]|nr:RHS repeat-associated core domain-containing protein [Clostridiales bacterium]